MQGVRIIPALKGLRYFATTTMSQAGKVLFTKYTELIQVKKLNLGGWKFYYNMVATLLL